MSTPLAGWYPNPDGSTDLRYWDGTSWTDRTRPGPSVPDTPATPVALPDEPTSPAGPSEPPTESSAPPAEVWPPTDPQATTRLDETGEPPAAPETPRHDTVLFPDTMAFPKDRPVPPAAPPAEPFPQVAPPPVTPPPTTPPPIASTPMTPPPAGWTTPAVAAPPPGFSPPPSPAMGYPAPPPYGSPAAPPMAPPVSTGSSGVGVAALIFGLLCLPLSFLCGFLGLPLAITAGVLGIVGIVQAGKTSGSRGFAIAGLVLGGVGLLLTIFWVLIFLTGSR